METRAQEDFNIAVITKEKCLEKVLDWLNVQAITYRSAARIAGSKKAKEIATAKADSYEFAAMEIAKW